MEGKPIISGKYLMYKGKPLLRERNMIVYGSTSDKYILALMIMSTKKIKDMSVPDRVMIQVLPTDPSDKTSPRTAVKQGIFEAFDLGLIWLNRDNQSAERD